MSRRLPLVLALLCLCAGVAQADALLLSMRFPAPVWQWIEVRGTGEVEIEAQVSEASTRSSINIYGYDLEGTPGGGIGSTIIDSSTWARVSGPFGVDENVSFVNDENDPWTVGARWTVGGIQDGLRVLVWGPTEGQVSINVTRNAGNLTATVGSRGDRSFFSEGADFGGPAQIVVNSEARARVQYEAVWPFHVDSILIGKFGYDDFPPVGYQDSVVVGPAGVYDCPCLFRDIDPARRVPPGEYEFRVTAATVGVFTGAVVEAVDVRT